MAESIRIPVQEQSQTADARRTARTLAQTSGFDENTAEQIAIVVTEACTNLVRHAGGGEILLRVTRDDFETASDLEMLSLDRGPGIADFAQALRDGFSTGGTPGQGLGAITRLSGETDFYSQGKGAALLARWSLKKNRNPVLENPLHVGAINVCKPGQLVCGDSWGARQTRDECTILVADGLGHGPEAKAASQEAVRMLRETTDTAPGRVLERVHLALRSSRGAAVAVARIDLMAGELVFAGIGNISAQIYAGATSGQHLVSVNGTAGFQAGRIREFAYQWPANGMLVLYSDGLATSSGVDSHPGLALCDPTLIAGVLYRDFSRGTDDATAVVAKGA